MGSGVGMEQKYVIRICIRDGAGMSSYFTHWGSLDMNYVTIYNNKALAEEASKDLPENVEFLDLMPVEIKFLPFKSERKKESFQEFADRVGLEKRETPLKRTHCLNCKKRIDTTNDTYCLSCEIKIARGDTVRCL
jgi:hypothetical protein